MAIKIHPHARERMAERGATEEEVRSAVEEGEKFRAKHGRSGFRRNFPFDGEWRKQHYTTKQVEAYADRRGEDWWVVTVITRFF